MAEGGYNIQSRNTYPDRMQQSQQSASAGEEELATKTLHIQSKRFYLDVKQNRRGRFIKIAEVSAGGRKSRILMSMNVASELRDHLDTFNEHIRTLGEHNPNNQQLTEDGRLRSALITRDDRKYYLDLKENDRGRFLRISMVGINTPRTQIALPAQGVEELRDTLNNLLEEFGNEDDKEASKLPESKFLRVGNKNFYFDIGSNSRGVFLRISEVRANFRAAITVPEKSWPRFRDNISDFILAMDKERNNALSTEDKSRLNSGNEDKSSVPQSSFGENKK
ncbi:unnamed protein product [Rotaria sordida]|uniref:Transcriptional activator protein Pur-alpha n=1 Tax=Rotaria sordida TaxID=392033 RepID=A0A818LG75_9BILA|nr:unnamed protein product [Rotaria sordida]CAF3657872.1 unnamed protein product [Rotaria sordida]CAF3669826.1 unnamed protein product [Rotaria sordida]